jgi:hypothetical protein
LTLCVLKILKIRGEKEYAVIPYKDYVRMQEEIEDYEDLKALRKAVAEPDFSKRRPYEEVSKKLGLMK